MDYYSDRRILCSFAVPDDMTFDDFEQEISLPNDVAIEDFRVLDEDDPYDGYLCYLCDFLMTTDVTKHESPLSYSECKLEY